ncbi:MAG: PAS domain S-box protein [Candidatus Electryonea clarkiae]|nr:PAS domain S-box protein [Candidatus Electryonea clarkiae]
MVQKYSAAVVILLILFAGCAEHKENENQVVEASVRGEMMKQVMNLQTELLTQIPSPELPESYITITEEIPFGIVLTDVDGNVLEANDMYQQITGYTLDELRELTYQQLTPEKWHKGESGFVQAASTVPYVSFEKEYVHKDGRRVPISLTGWVIKDTEGKVIGTGSFVRDLTDRIKLEGF